MTRVLIAVDGTDESVDAARVAHELFGDGAEYLVVNVADPVVNGMAWGYVYPVVPPIAAYPVMMPVNDPPVEGAAGQGSSAIDEAEHVAAEAADKAHLDHAETMGGTGDAALAIIDAADEHSADVIVVGSHERGWFDKLLKASVAKRVLSESSIPVLVVK